MLSDCCIHFVSLPTKTAFCFATDYMDFAVFESYSAFESHAAFGMDLT